MAGPKQTYCYRGQEMIFNKDQFRKLFTAHARMSGMSQDEYEMELGEIIGVASGSIHNWKLPSRSNPADLEKIQAIADIWNIDPGELLKEDAEVEVKSNGIKLTDREKAALKNVHSAFYTACETFKASNGFMLSIETAEKNLTLAQTMYDNLIRTLDLEYIDLKEKLYDQLYTYFAGVFRDIIYDYFFEDNEDEGPSVDYIIDECYELLWSDYYKIIDPFLI